MTESPDRKPQTSRRDRSTGQQARRTSLRGARRAEWGWAALFILPTTVGLGVFSLWPIFQTFYFSFTTWGAFGGHEWSGLKNYQTCSRTPSSCSLDQHADLHGDDAAERARSRSWSRRC